MTLQEAKLFFPFEEADDLDDLYAERLFEYKQFFISKTPIRKVFESKLVKLKQMHDAYCLLTNMPIVEVENKQYNVVQFSDELKSAFSEWERLKSQVKQELTIANHALQLIQTISWYLSIVDTYRLKWYTEELIEVEIDQLSKDPDPMEILQAINDFEQSGGKTFEDILKMRSNIYLLKEMKRLSLLVKNYGDGRSI
ncbi:MAG TPA: hypothetical protein VKZ44_09910 [Taishania sp.]|nr:hypothetical protein [Taishania sp.]